MKRLLALGWVALILLPGLVGLLPATGSRYVSDWAQLQPGEKYAFEHQLGTLPMSVDGQAAEVNGKREPTAYVPYTDWPGIHLLVDDRFVTVVNDSDTAANVRVVAER